MRSARAGDRITRCRCDGTSDPQYGSSLSCVLHVRLQCTLQVRVWSSPYRSRAVRKPNSSIRTVQCRAEGFQCCTRLQCAARIKAAKQDKLQHQGAPTPTRSRSLLRREWQVCAAPDAAPPPRVAIGPLPHWAPFSIAGSINGPAVALSPGAAVSAPPPAAASSTSRQLATCMHRDAT